MRHNVRLKLDLSFFEGEQPGNTPRRFALDRFAISGIKAARYEVALVNDRGTSRLRTAAVSAVQRLLRYSVFRERFFHFDPEVLCLPNKVYLEGYWQSERYFAEHTEDIRREFTMKQPCLGRNRELADAIASVNAVSLHVRRGDYVTDAKTNAAHGVCAVDYYCKAADMIARAVENPVFFLFSDEPEWVAANLDLRYPVVHIGHNGDAPHEDLRLMSQCRHHIIANSSFSWWGAWLSANPDKIVIAPKRWFNDPAINTDDLTPAGWQRI